MSKRSSALLLLCLMMLTSLAAAGCSASQSWEAKLSVPSVFQAGTKLPLKLTVTDKGRPVSGLTINAILKMARMEHDTIQVLFHEQDNGVYEADAQLPMNGEWEAELLMVKNGVKQEQTVSFRFLSN